MKKRALVLTIVFSCFAAFAVIGLSVFGLFFFKNKNNILTPPTPNKDDEEIIIDPTTYPDIPDSTIASQFDVSPIYEGFTLVGYKINGATEEAVQNGKLIIPKAYHSLPILAIGNAFNNWTEIEQIVLPDTLIYVGVENSAGSFKGCSALAQVQFPEGNKIQNIGDNAFYNCTELSAFDFGTNLKSIGDNAFCYTKIETVSLPASTNSIGTNPFAFSNLKTIIISTASSVYESSNNCIIEKETNKLVVGSQNGQIKDGVEVVGENAFAGVVTSGNIVFPSSVQVVEKGAFKLFDGNIELNVGLKTIKSEAFFGSTVVLEGVPDSVEEIGSEVFYGCENLAETFIARGVIKIGLVVFANTPVINLTLHIGVVAETEDDVDYKTGSIIENVYYYDPAE